MPVVLIILVFSCGGGPKSQPPIQQEPQEEEFTGPVKSPESEPFDPKSISREDFDAAKKEIQKLIQNLNVLIQEKNYTAWISYLDVSYFNQINSREYLDDINRKSERLKKANIRLVNAKDYFDHVVVPSRVNDRVDDIEFVSRARVKAFTAGRNGNKLRLYDLEKTNSGWKIIN